MAEVKEKPKSGEIPEGIPALYFNSFAFGTSPTDVFLLPHLNGQPLLTLNFPYSQAKSLAEALNEAIEAYETRTKQNVLSFHELQATYEK